MMPRCSGLICVDLYEGCGMLVRQRVMLWATTSAAWPSHLLSQRPAPAPRRSNLPSCLSLSLHIPLSVSRLSTLSISRLSTLSISRLSTLSISRLSTLSSHSLVSLFSLYLPVSTLAISSLFLSSQLSPSPIPSRSNIISSPSPLSSAADPHIRRALHVLNPPASANDPHAVGRLSDKPQGGVVSFLHVVRPGVDSVSGEVELRDEG